MSGPIRFEKRHLDKADELLRPYKNDFGDLGALEQLAIDIAVALVDAEDEAREAATLSPHDPHPYR